MEEKHLYTSDDKFKWWGYGEWVEEPDEVNFEHRGIKCYITRVVAREPFAKDFHPFGGHLCGYVCVPKEHAVFEKDVFECEYDFDVHGGVTYGGDRFKNNEFWIGFDCAHGGDYVPCMQFLRKNHPEPFPVPEEFKKYSIFNPQYKNMNYCIEECKSLAEQISSSVGRGVKINE